MKFWLKGLAVLLVIGVWLGWGVGQAVGQCTGQGICCDNDRFRCKIGSSYHDVADCRKISNLGKTCIWGVGTGICMCSSAYTVGCNAAASCTPFACVAGDYLIDETCYAPVCTISDGGCGAGACLPTQMLRVNSCGGANCVASASCAHRACVGQTCTLVAGAGANECSVNADCVPQTHLACVDRACVSVAGAGANECGVDFDCVPKYTVSGRVYLDNFNNR